MNILKGLGYAFLGLSTLSELNNRARRTQLQGLNGASRPRRSDVGTPLAGEDALVQKALEVADQKLRARSLTKGKLHRVGDIDARVAYIGKELYEGSLEPEVRSAAVALLSRKCRWKGGVRWCTTPKDHWAEVNTLYVALQDAKSPLALRYVRDHVGVDQFTQARQLVRFVRGGDCDDGTIKLGAMLMSVGYNVEMRVIQSVNSNSWDHIYLLVMLPARSDVRGDFKAAGSGFVWVPLDWSVVGPANNGTGYTFKPMGWEAPGAGAVARSGRPAGMVRRVKDYPIMRRR